MSRSEATSEQRSEHAWCVQLRSSQAFAFFLREMSRPMKLAHREVCAADPKGSREFHAGRLSAFAEASQIIDRKYAELQPIVEVV